MPHPKLMVMVSFYKKINFLPSEIKNKSVLLTMSLKLMIEVVAFFLGHPVYTFQCAIFKYSYRVYSFNQSINLYVIMASFRPIIDFLTPSWIISTVSNMFAEADSGCSLGGGGGGGGQKIMSAHLHHERQARSPLRPRSRGPYGLRALEALAFQNLMFSHVI